MAGPCTGLTVIDFSMGMPGSLATAVFADFGASVIKVEPPGGDPFRAQGAWLAWNRGKKSVVLDLETGEGREQAAALARTADIVVESYRPGEMAGLGLDYDTLSRTNPRLVYCSISSFGQTGRLKNLKGYEGVIAAKSGRMHSFEGQTPRPGPVYVAVQTATWASSQAAVRGILGALRVRNRTDRGQWVQTSVLQGMISSDIPRVMGASFSRKDPGRFKPNTTEGPVLPSLGYIPVRTKEGRWLQHANNMGSPRLLIAHLKAIGLGWVLEDERFKDTPILTEENREILRELILEKMQEKTVDEWMDIYVEDGDVAAEPFAHTTEGMQHSQFLYNRHVIEIEDPRVGPMKVVGLVADLTESPGEVGGPAPSVGEHTAEVLASLRERSAVQIAGGSDSAATAAPKHLLEGITLLDLSTVLAGPYSASMIADMGARVIKVDATPEYARFRAPTNTPSQPNFAMELRTYNGKESLQVNLQTAEGQDLIHKLIAEADVLLHNFRPGAPERLKIDWETCRQINPRLIHVYSGAYGATGPHSRRPGAHPVPGALFGGALRQIGREVPPPPDRPMTMEEIKDTSRRLMRANEGNPDINTSQAIGTAVMLGLWDRERTGKGQSIQVTMLCANAYANHDEAYEYEGRPPVAISDADCYGPHALYRLYHDSDDGFVFLACPFQDEWERFCATVDRPDLLTDARFADQQSRQSHDDELIAELSQLFVTRSAADWEELLTAQDVACVRATDTGKEEFWLDEPHVRDNDLAVETEDESPRYGKYIRLGGIMRMSEMPGRFRGAAYPGQHTAALMQEFGYTDEEIASYRERRIVDWEEANPLFAK